MKTTTSKPSVIIVGGGLSAIWLALKISPETDVYIFSEKSWENSGSFHAMGGMAAPADLNDIESHIADTLQAGSGKSNEDQVSKLIREGWTYINELVTEDVYWDRDFALEGGHSRPRIRHKGDYSGAYLTSRIHLKSLQQPNIHRLEFTKVEDLILEQNSCIGVKAIEIKTGRRFELYADAIILATGGCSGLYKYHTGGEWANGEGLGMAIRAGAHTSNLEYIQFHPTYGLGKDENMLMTEALRGAGAGICSIGGKNLTLHLMQGELSTRDIISRVIYNHLQESGDPYVYLDIRRVPEALLESHFPKVYRFCEVNHLLSKKLIPVVPAAHYQCGGIVIDENGCTNIMNLYALGEVACTGLHGANRLASNSLMEIMVMAARLGKYIIQRMKNLKMIGHFKVKDIDLYEFNPEPVEQLTEAIQEIMWNHFGIVRNPDAMDTGLQKLHLLRAQVNFQDSTCLNIFDNRWTAAYGIAGACMNNTVSAGCHYIVNDQTLPASL